MASRFPIDFLDCQCPRPASVAGADRQNWPRNLPPVDDAAATRRTTKTDLPGGNPQPWVYEGSRSHGRTNFPRPVEMTRLAQCPLADPEGTTPHEQ